MDVSPYNLTQVSRNLSYNEITALCQTNRTYTGVCTPSFWRSVAVERFGRPIPEWLRDMDPKAAFRLIESSLEGKGRDPIQYDIRVYYDFPVIRERFSDLIQGVGIQVAYNNILYLRGGKIGLLNVLTDGADPRYHRFIAEYVYTYGDGWSLRRPTPLPINVGNYVVSNKFPYIDVHNMSFDDLGILFQEFDPQTYITLFILSDTSDYRLSAFMYDYSTTSFSRFISLGLDPGFAIYLARNGHVDVKEARQALWSMSVMEDVFGLDGIISALRDVVG